MRGVERRPCPLRLPELKVSGSLTVGIFEQVRVNEAHTRCRCHKACTWEEIATGNRELFPRIFDKSVNILRPSAARGKGHI